MALIGFTSVHGAPGTTTLALAVAHHWPAQTRRPALFVEADADGGVVAARHGLSLQPGLTELAGAARLGLPASELARFIQSMSSGVPVIVAHPAAEQTSAALRASASHLAATLAEVPGSDVVVDLGRLRPGSPGMALAGACDVLVVVASCEAEDLVSVLTRLPLIERVAPLALALVGKAPYPVDEVRRASGLTSVHLIAQDDAVVRKDPVGARIRRAGWAQSVSTLTRHLVEATRPSTEAAGDLDGAQPADDEMHGHRHDHGAAPIMAVGV